MYNHVMPSWVAKQHVGGVDAVVFKDNGKYYTKVVKDGITTSITPTPESQIPEERVSLCWKMDDTQPRLRSAQGDGSIAHLGKPLEGRWVTL